MLQIGSVTCYKSISIVMNELFFELIRVALGNADGLSHIPKPKEWQLLYEMAKKQSLVGVCFAGVQKLVDSEKEDYCGMNEMQYLTWMGMAAKIQQKNEIVNKQCVELQKRLDGDVYRNYIMKGQSNAALYGDLQMLRQSGDIDVYLEGGLENVLAYAKSFGNVEHVNELEMSVPIYQDTEVEFHYRPFIMRNPFKNRKLQTYFDACSEANFANKVYLHENENSWIVAPTTEFNLVHQLAHIHLHLFTEGIGMRQLMDYYFVIQFSSVSPLKDECVENVKKVISELRLNRFASALMWVLEHVFGLEREYMLWEPCEKDGRLLLDEVMTGGNFGRYNEEQNDRKGKRGYSVWALFFRNLRLLRFDRGDWFWESVCRS